jgi:YbbR domain-containing protein
MIRHNMFYKLLALGVAVGLFLYVNAEQNPRARKTYTVPLAASNVAKGYVAEVGQDEASVTISGLKSIMDSIQRVAAVVDLSSATPSFGRAEKTFKVKTSIFGVAPADLDDLDIRVNPQSVKVRIEALSGKRMPVEVKFPAAPPLGYSYSNPVLIPGSVSISGRSTEVSQVKRVVLALPNQFSDGSIDDYFSLTPLDSSGNKVEDVSLSPKKVRLKIEMVEVPATKTVIVSPNIQGEPKYPFKVSRVTATPSSITLMGRPSALAGVSTITTDRISIDGAEGNVTHNADLKVPPGIRVSGHTSVKVAVYIGTQD